MNNSTARCSTARWRLSSTARWWLTICALGLLLLPGGAAEATMRPALADDTPALPETAWQWPVDGPRDVVQPFRAPEHEYGPGHRGVDITVPGDTAVRAPADGVVAFRGTVVDRPLLTIDHGGGLVTTFEPVTSALNPGDVVTAEQDLGVLGTGGHAAPGSMHLGARLDGVYINPMLLFGDVPRAILLPCCAAL